MRADSIRTALFRDGWFATPPVVTLSVVDELISEFEETARPGGRRGGIRGLLSHHSIQELVRERAVRTIVEAELGGQAFACRAILFDKVPESNWKVTWHQDLTIAVSDRLEEEGFGPWSIKSGIHHVQAPRHVLEKMLAVRVHLDSCTINNGPLQVLPGSHRLGTLKPDEIDGQVAHVPPVDCVGDRCSIVAFKPLLLHRSSKAIEPSHRRVVHIELAGVELPGELNWKERVYAST